MFSLVANAVKARSALEAAGVPIIGTTPDAIDAAEDRERFQQMLNELNSSSQRTESSETWTRELVRPRKLATRSW